MQHRFLEKLAEFGAADAVVMDGQTRSYSDLVLEIKDWSVFIDEQGITAGTVVTIEGRCSFTLCAGLIALVARDAIVVPLTALPARKREEFLEIAQVETTITVDEYGSRTVVATGQTADHELYEQLRSAEVPGLVLFSSGTSGRCKASVLDFDRALARYQRQSRPLRMLSFLSLDHIGGINTLFHTLSQGGTVVTVDERTPDTIMSTIAREHVEVLPTTPTFLNMLLISGAVGRHAVPSLKLITYGTEPMPASTLRRLRVALPDVQLKQTYGLSELGILPTRSRDADSLWVKVGGAGFEYKIVDGILWVRSEMAMLGYLNAAAPFDADGYFNTLDAVEVDGDYLRILGRRSEIINVGGEKVYPAEVESVILEVPGIADAMVLGVASPVTGKVVKAIVRLDGPEDQRSVERRVRKHCASTLERFKVPVLVEVSTDDQHSDRFKKMRQTS